MHTAGNRVMSPDGHVKLCMFICHERARAISQCLLLVPVSSATPISSFSSRPRRVAVVMSIYLRHSRNSIKQLFAILILIDSANSTLSTSQERLNQRRIGSSLLLSVSFT
jgi:hypothetical protein